MMLYDNQFGIRPGVYHIGEKMVVVSDIITHHIEDGVEKELTDPLVVFRIEIDMKIHKRYSVKLSEFKKVNHGT